MIVVDRSPDLGGRIPHKIVAAGRGETKNTS